VAAFTVLDGALIPAAEARIPADDPAVTLGWSVFETLAWPEAELGPHLARLAASAAATGIAPPDPDVVAAEIARAGGAVGGPARVRVTLTGGGRRLVRAEPLDPARRHQPVRAARGPHRDDPFLGGAVKHGSRAGWVVAVRRAAVDEVLLVDEAGRFTEGTTSGILAVIGGVLWTAPHDGRILESTTVTSLLRDAAALGLPVRREGPPAAGPWDALYIASATRHLAPVAELDGAPLPVWDPVGRALARAG
jgi:branched-chain amino acid aminotransferase